MLALPFKYLKNLLLLSAVKQIDKLQLSVAYR